MRLFISDEPWGTPSKIDNLTPAMTFEQIGRELGMTTMGACKAYHRAMKKLEQNEALQKLAKEFAA